jgi:hypothetical protein
MTYVHGCDPSEPMAFNQAHANVQAKDLPRAQVAMEKQLELDKERQGRQHIDPVAELGHVHHVLEHEQDCGDHGWSDDEPVPMLVLENWQVFAIHAANKECE